MGADEIGMAAKVVELKQVKLNSGRSKVFLLTTSIKIRKTKNNGVSNYQAQERCNKNMKQYII